MASKLLLSSVSIHVCLFAYVYVYLSVSFLPISVCLWLWTSFFHSLISFQTVSNLCFSHSDSHFCLMLFDCDVFASSCHISWLHSKCFTCGPSLSVFLFLSVSLMEHLPAHTFLRSCPLLTHLSIHTCLSACVCVFVSMSLHRQGKDSLPCKHTCQTSPQPSTVCLCMCVGVKHHARRSRQMRRKLFLQQHLLRRASSWDVRCARVCAGIFAHACTLGALISQFVDW